MQYSFLEIQETNLPHQPCFIKDDSGNVIATIYHNDKIHPLQYAKLFRNAPKMEKVLWKVLEYFSKCEDNIDLDILRDISEIQVELTEPIPSDKPRHWHDEIMEKHKNDTLAKIFRENNNKNNKNYLRE